MYTKVDGVARRDGAIVQRLIIQIYLTACAERSHSVIRIDCRWMILDFHILGRCVVGRYIFILVPMYICGGFVSIEVWKQ